MGRKKTAVYVVLVTIFSTLAGVLFGGWLEFAEPWDGASHYEIN